MYKPQYIQYLNLPSIPADLVATINKEYKEHQLHNNQRSHGNYYVWSDLNNQSINTWCQANICSSVYFAFQMMCLDVPTHKDHVSQIKINYVLETGGDQVLTNFYDDDQNLLESYCIEPNRWHIFDASVYHSVTNIAANQVRFGITGRIF